MEQSNVKKFYNENMKVEKGMKNDNILNKYTKIMNSRKSFTNDELLELAKYMLTDSILNGVKFFKMYKHGIDGRELSGKIFMDMSERGVVFSVPMVTNIFKFIEDKTYWIKMQACVKNMKTCLINMLMNGYTMSKSQLNRLDKIYIEIPIQYFINKGSTVVKVNLNYYRQDIKNL